MKKNTLLILITAFYIACFIGVMSLLNEKNLQIKLVFFVTCLYFYIFSKLLKRTGNVYWLAGFDYEDYKKMSLDERFEISSKYAKDITVPSFMFCIYQLVSLYLHINTIIDAVIFFICLLLMCFPVGKKKSQND